MLRTMVRPGSDTVIVAGPVAAKSGRSCLSGMVSGVAVTRIVPGPSIVGLDASWEPRESAKRAASSGEIVALKSSSWIVAAVSVRLARDPPLTPAESTLSEMARWVSGAFEGCSEAMFRLIAGPMISRASVAVSSWSASRRCAGSPVRPVASVSSDVGTLPNSIVPRGRGPAGVPRPGASTWPFM
jgi:hypothetical protein